MAQGIPVGETITCLARDVDERWAKTTFRSSWASARVEGVVLGEQRTHPDSVLIRFAVDGENAEPRAMKRTAFSNCIQPVARAELNSEDELHIPYVSFVHPDGTDMFQSQHFEREQEEEHDELPTVRQSNSASSRNNIWLSESSRSQNDRHPVYTLQWQTFDPKSRSVEKHRADKQHIPARAACHAKDKDRSPLEFFMTMFPLRIWNTVREATIANARSKGDESFDLTVYDLMKYHALLMAMNLCVLPSLDMYWSQSGDRGMVSSLFRFADVMSFRKFKAMCRYLDFISSSSERNECLQRPNSYDTMSKIRPIADEFQQAFLLGLRPGTRLFVDEGGFPYKSCRSFPTSFSAQDSHRWFMTLFCLRDAETRYCWNFTPYAERVVTNHATRTRTAVNEQFLEDLTHPLYSDVGRFQHLQGKRILFLDKYFNSIKTAFNLLQHGIQVVGTLGPLGSGWMALKQLITCTNADQSERQEDNRVAVADTTDGPMYVSCWRDKSGPLYSLSTAYEPTASTLVRTVGGMEVVTDGPEHLRQFQKAMGGRGPGQRKDHYRSRESRYSLLKNPVLKAWHHSYYVSMVDLALDNAFILYTHVHAGDEDCMNLRDFWIAIYNALLAPDEEIVYRTPSLPSPPLFSSPRKSLSVESAPANAEWDDDHSPVRKKSKGKLACTRTPPLTPLQRTRESRTPSMPRCYPKGQADELMREVQCSDNEAATPPPNSFSGSEPPALLPSRPPTSSSFQEAPTSRGISPHSDPAQHNIQKAASLRECVVCRQKAGKRKRSSYECAQCNVGLCANQCYTDFHSHIDEYRIRRRRNQANV